MKVSCKDCNIEQMHRLAEMLSLPGDDEAELARIARDIVATYDDEPNYEDNPASMGDIWRAISPVIGTDDPYRATKRRYNDVTIALASEANEQVRHAANPAQLALRFAAVGNLIDFGPNLPFDEDTLRRMLAEAPGMSFAIDDTADLIERARSARTLLYLADNCGEVALDKLLLAELSRENPHLEVVYAVRELPIMNDVTRDDAEQAGMADVARVITNGDRGRTPGTYLPRCSQEFRDAFERADVVIAKGQGNLETLYRQEREGLFFMLMTKCSLIAGLCGCPRMSIVCMEATRARGTLG